MRKPRVLVVDDSVVARRLISNALESDRSIDVVGVAADGKIALEKLLRIEVDLVVLDIEMPVMDGLASLAEMRRRWPGLPVVMFSTLTERGASATLDALALGASDYVAKPREMRDLTQSVAYIKEHLVPKVFALCPSVASPAALGPLRPARRTMPVPIATPPPRSGPLPRVDVVAIGVSTGGPNALAELLPSMPSSFPVPILIVQHMPPTFTRLLAERLDARSELSVAEGRDGAIVGPGSAWIARGDEHMIIERSRPGVLCLRTYVGPPENSCRPAVDPLFRSVASVFGENVLGVVLTGMGADGLRGAERIRSGGGQIIVQDEESSVVWGMPGFVAAAGLADAVVPISHVCEEIAARVGTGRPSAVVAERAAR